MRMKVALAALVGAGALVLAASPSQTVSAAPLGAGGLAASEKADNGLVEEVGRRWRHRGARYYPRRYYRPYDYSYYQPYYAPYYAPYYRPYYSGYGYYAPYYRPYWGGYYGRFYGPRFGFAIGW